MSSEKEREKEEEKDGKYVSRRDAFVYYVNRMGMRMFLDKKKRDNPNVTALCFHRKRTRLETDCEPSTSTSVKNDSEASSSHAHEVPNSGLTEGATSSQQPDFSALHLLAEAAALFSALEDKQKLKQKQKHLPQHMQNNSKPSFELPLEFKEKIEELNGCDVKFLLQKNLFKSDTNKNEGRLSIPPTKIEIEFLTQTEKSKLDERDEKNRIIGMDVLVLDPCVRECNVRFKKWTMSRGSVYYLTSTWNTIVKNNDLKIDDTLQIWSFRVDSKLCFALVKP